MCLSTVYTLESGGEMSMLCEYVSAVEVSGDALKFTDIMGAETGVSGSIRSVDLVKNTIVVEKKQDA
jgi:predicted RNA-binding protein